MSLAASQSQLWKREGNDHVKNGRYLKAIECYDTALSLTKTPSEACTLLLNRSHARLQLHAYDDALADARAALGLPPARDSPCTEGEKGLFRLARALYGLREYKDCLDCLEHLLNLFPHNPAAKGEIWRCEMRLREEKGEIDFGDMLREATEKFPSPDMDRADFVGPIEVRVCANPDHGRGLFTTRDVRAGDLLLCEKALAAAFAGAEGSGLSKKNSDHNVESHVEDGEGVVSADEETGEGGTGPTGKRHDLDDPKDKEMARLRAELATKTFVKLHRNPSLQKGFMDLYPGPDADEEVDEETGEVEVDDAAVHYRIKYNAFGFPLLSHTYHHATAHDPYSPSIFTSANSRGIWLRASYINHSCYPLVRRSFLGDMMIFRAQADIPANIELKFGYISAMEPLKERRIMLGKYGFECGCQICKAEAATSGKKMRRRDAVTKEIIALFEAEKPTGFHTYMEKLEALEKTYIHPPTVEPRKAVITPVMNIVPELLRSQLYTQAIDFILRLLNWLGFELAITETSFVVVRWGFLVDDIVMALADLCDACRVVRPGLLKGAEGVAKRAYLIMCGEDVSWEGEYGRGGRHEMEGRMGSTRKVEDLVDGVEGMGFVEGG